jgi:hypothetical protein
MSPRRIVRLLFEMLAALTLVIIAAAARADAVTDWNEVMQGTVERVDPYMQIRTSVIIHLAVFDAVNSIVGDYEPYLAKIEAPQRASAEAAAIAAAHRALSALHPDQALPLDARLKQDLARIPDGAAKDAGVKVGIAAADAILAKRADDGSDIEVPYEPGTKPGEHRPTPPDFTPAFRPGMGRVVPFTSCSTAQFRPEPPPALDSARYARDLAEVRKGGDVNSPTRTRYQTDIARFYEVTDAVQLWYPAARQVSRAQRKTLSQNARIFALLGMAMFDAVIGVFEAKYHYNYWRPVTAIRETSDPNWMPLVFSPPFPGYPSGHAGFGAAARIVLENELGRSGHFIRLTNPLIPDVTLRYTRWKQITTDVDDARVFGGVHFRFDQVAAGRQGRFVGEYVLQRYLRPLRRH